MYTPCHLDLLQNLTLMLHLSTEFHENWVSSFSVILLTNRQTDQTENITSIGNSAWI